MKKGYKTGFALGLCFTLLSAVYGCGKNETQALQPCEYQQEAVSRQADFLTNQDLAEYVNANSVSVHNQVWNSKNYQYTLKECFYDGTIGLCVSTIEIRGKDGADLKEDEIENWKTMIQQDVLDVSIEDHDSTPLERDVTYGEHSVSFRQAFTFSTICDKDTTKNPTSCAQGLTMQLTEQKKNGVETGCLALPKETVKHTDQLTLKKGKSSEVLSIEITPYGAQVIWNTAQAEKNYKKQMEKGAEEEDLDLEIWNTMKLVETDGKEFDLCSGSMVYTNEDEENTDNHLAVYQVIFSKKISLKNVKNMVIDDRKYEV